MSRRGSLAGAAFAACVAAANAAAWAAPLTFEHFTNVLTQAPATLPTVVTVSFDAQTLYVSFQCSQRGVPITATQHTDEIGFGVDDYVEVGIDTAGNGSQTYYFETTPNAVKFQSLAQATRYRPHWKARASRTASGWTATMAIPLDALRLQPGAAQHWRMNFTRFISALNEHDTWAYNRNMQATTDVQFWPYVDLAIAGKAPRIPLVSVYGLQSWGPQAYAYVDAAGNVTQASPRIAGIDAVVPLTSSLAFVGTLSPDFTNVEADQDTITPQQFARYYVEYRPFFAAGAKYFDLTNLTPADPRDVLLYTPSIGIFNRGLKVEGTAGNTSLGVMNVIGPDLGLNAFGVQQQAPDQSYRYYAEGVFSNVPGVHDDALELGFRTYSAKTGLIVAASASQEAGTLVSSSSLAQNVLIDVGVRRAHYETFLAYRDIGPQYGPVLGYTAFNDARGPQAYADATYTSEGPIKSLYVGYGGYRYVDRTGAVSQVQMQPFLDVLTRSNLEFTYAGQIGSSRSYTTPYPYYLGGQTQPFNYSSVTFAVSPQSPNSAAVLAAWGPFENFLLQEQRFSVSRVVGAHLSAEYTYDITHEHFLTGTLTQQLNRISLVESLGPTSDFRIGLRTITGLGGFAVPGTNLSVSFHRRFGDRGELFVNFGSPATATTLDRGIVKFTWQALGQN